MIRENQRLFNIFNIILDVVVLLVSTLFINYYTVIMYPIDNIFTLDSIVIFLVLLIPSYLILYREFGLYKPRRTNRNIFSESSKIIQANFVEYLFLSVLLTLDAIDVSATFLLFFLIINSIFAIVERGLVRVTLRAMRANGFNIKYILIVGAGEVGRNLLETINVNTYLGYDVVGFLDDYVIGTVNGVKVIGTLDDIEDVLSYLVVDRVIVSISPRHYKQLDKVMETCEKNGIRADIVADYYRYITSRPSVELLDNIPLISVRYLPLDITYNKYFKRIFDIVFAIIMAIVTSPILLVVAIIIKFTSPGPIIFTQERVGENGTHFKIYKFRSMREDIEVEEDTWTKRDDPRITRIGRVIRRWSIDELPQIYNIVKGDMSLIGPRPERPIFVNKFKESVPKYMIKHHVKPGMTGWAQVNGYRGNTSIVKRIEYDIYYVENWSILLDIRIFFRTIGMILVDKNAY